MKRVISFICMALIAVASAFAAATNDQCTSIIDAISAGDYARAEGMTIKIYSQKSSCSAATLADLAVIYHKLTEKSTDPVTRYDYVLKAIDCYKSAVAANASVAKAQFAARGVDMATVVKNYNANLSKYQQGVSDSMKF